MSLYASGNHMVPDVEKNPPEAKCPICGSTDIEDAYECEDCHAIAKKKGSCGNTDCDSDDLRAVIVCNNCEHTWRE